MMRVRDQTGAHTQQRQRINLHMRGMRQDARIIQRNVGIVFLIHIQVLDQALLDEIIKVAIPLIQLLLTHIHRHTHIQRIPVMRKG